MPPKQRPSRGTTSLPTSSTRRRASSSARSVAGTSRAAASAKRGGKSTSALVASRTPTRGGVGGRHQKSEHPRLFTRISIVYYAANEPEPWLATVEDFPKKALGGSMPPHGHGKTIKTALKLALREVNTIAWAYRKLHGELPQIVR